MNMASHCAGSGRFVARLLTLGMLLIAGAILISPPASGDESVTSKGTADGGTITTHTKQDANTKTVTNTTTNKELNMTEKSTEVTDLKTNATTTTTTTYTGEANNNKAKDTTIVKKDGQGNVTSTEYQVWGTDGTQSGGWIQWPQKGKTKHKYDPDNKTYKDPDATPPSNGGKPPTGSEKPDKPKKPKKSKGGESFGKSKGGESKGKSKWKDADPDPSDIRSDPSYADAIKTPPWAVGTPSGSGHQALAANAPLLRDDIETDITPRDEHGFHRPLDNGFYIAMSGTLFAGRGNHTVTTIGERHVKETFFTIEKTEVTELVPFDNGFTIVDVPVTHIEEEKVKHQRIKTVKFKKKHDEGNFDDAAGGATLEVGYNRGDFGVGLDFLLMDGEDLFGGVGADFYWRISNLACACQCGQTNVNFTPYLVVGPTLFFGEESTATGHLGGGVNIDMGKGVQGFVEFQQHIGSHDMHWSACEIGIRVALESIQRGESPYKNIHTESIPGGEIRGQMNLFKPD